MTAYVDETAQPIEPVPRDAEAVALAIIGVGRMGMLHAALIARHVPAIDVVVFSDSRPEPLRRAGVLFPAADTVEDGVATAKQPGLEACLVATSTSNHREVVEAALEHGIHVFCEKPITLDVQETAALSAQARRAGVTLQTGFWRRFSPPWAVARDALLAGAIGAPVLVRSSQWDASAPPLPFCDRHVSGGLFVDCGVHDFDIVEWVTGSRITAVTAPHLRRTNPELTSVGDVDNGMVILELDDGSAGVIDLTRNGGYDDEVRMEILGTGGSIMVTTDPRGRAVIRTTAGVEELTRPTETRPFELGVVGELRAFAARCRNAETAIPDATDDVRALQVALAAWQSYDSGGRRIEIDAAPPSPTLGGRPT